MSTRSFGMVGKTYKTASEAFKDATWSTAIERPTERRYEVTWALSWAFFVVGGFGYCVWQTISHF